MGALGQGFLVPGRKCVANTAVLTYSQIQPFTARCFVVDFDVSKPFINEAPADGFNIRVSVETFGESCL